MNTITIDFENCNGCRKCYKACFVNVFTWDQDNNQPMVSHPEDCVHCNVCELACPGEFITVTPDFVYHSRWSAL